jgi:pyruvate kinase
MLNKSTAIVATIGPATETEEVLEKLINAGMNVARFNTKHGEPSWHHERIRRVRAVAERLQQPVGVLIDLQGPEIRTILPNNQDSFETKAGEIITLTANQSSTNEKTIIVPTEVVEAVKEGDKILIEDGLGEFNVVGKENGDVQVQVADDLVIKKRKTLNTPGVDINLPSLIATDFEHLDAATNDLVDFVALSFVRTAEDIEILRTELKKRNLSAQIVAKIENQSAVDHLDEIIQAADAVMVARGDLGVEVPYQELAHWQKVTIYKSRIYGKPVITATQMLMSMVNSPRPSRAEVSDVANAVYDGTDAVMLSDETTIGKYPVKAVKTQSEIVAFTEKYSRPPIIDPEDIDAGTSITHAAVSLLMASQRPTNVFHIDQVVCLTETGATVRHLSRYRYTPSIHALTDSKQTYNRLSLVYGVTPHIVEFSIDTLIDSDQILKKIQELEIATSGQTVLVVHGNFWKQPGLTNTLKVLQIP